MVRLPKMLETFWDKTIAFIAILVAIALCAAGVAYLLRVFAPRPQIVVSPFEVFIVGSDQKADTRTSKALADLLVDRLNDIIEQAHNFRGGQFSSLKSSGPLRPIVHIPVETTYGLEIKGISVDQLLAMWKHIRYEDFRVSGELILGGPKQMVVLRYAGKGQQSFPEPVRLNDPLAVKHAIDKLGLELIEDLDPEVAARYYLGRMGTCTPNCEDAKKTALDFSKKWVKKSPDDPVALFHLGFTLSSDPDEAIGGLPFLSRALELDPRMAPAFISEGLILMKYCNDDDNAKKRFQKALLIRRSPNALMNLGVIAIRNKHYKDAEWYLTRAIRADPQDFGAYYNMGEALLRDSKYGEAVKAFRAAFSINPQSEFALLGLVVALYKDGALDEEIDQACNQGGNIRQPVKLVAKGVKELEENENVGAIRSFEAARNAVQRAQADLAKSSNDRSGAKTNPTREYDVLWHHLAVAYAQKRDFKSAEECLREMKTMDGGDHLLLARVLQALGHSKASEAELDRACKEEPWVDNESWDDFFPLSGLKRLSCSSHRPAKNQECAQLISH